MNNTATILGLTLALVAVIVGGSWLFQAQPRAQPTEQHPPTSPEAATDQSVPAESTHMGTADADVIDRRMPLSAADDLSDMHEQGDTVVSQDASIPAASGPEPTTTTNGPVGDLAIEMKGVRFLPLTDVSRETARVLCALAAGHLCTWRGTALQQSYRLSDVLLGDENALDPDVSLNPSRPVRISFSDPQGAQERYRTYVVTFDIMGRPYQVYEAHITDGRVTGDRVVQDWEYQVRFLGENDELALASLTPSTKFTLVVVAVESGRFGRVDHQVGPGTPPDGLNYTNLRPYLPEHKTFFKSWLGRGTLIDGGEGYDTVEYSSPSRMFDFVRATTTPAFIRSVVDDEAAESGIKVHWFYREYDRAIGVVSGADKVDVLLDVEAIEFPDTILEVDDLMQRVEQGDGVIYSERGAPEQGIAF